MNRKYFCLLVAIWIYTVVCKAQLEKKTNIVAFQFGAYSHEEDSIYQATPPFNIKVLEDRGGHINFMWMRHITPNQSMGAMMSFENQNYKSYYGFHYGYMRYAVGVMLNHRLWFPINKSFNFYTQSRLGYQRLWQDGKGGSSYNNPINYWGNRYSYVIEPGITYKLNKRFWLDLSWRNAFNIYYQKINRETYSTQIPLGPTTDWGMGKQSLQMGNLGLIDKIQAKIRYTPCYY